jgi:2OG-Fe(II) oxygenase superfamily
MDSGSGYDSELEVSDAESLKDEEEVVAETKAELLACLDAVQAEGSFSAFHHADKYPNPGLHIHDHGSVGLPIATKDAKAIASVCQQAPFGLKDQTVIDTAVRRTWELDNSHFECQNPGWPAYVEYLTRQATSALGVTVTARAEIYKLLLYEEGAFFKAHKDTEKVPGMFGTMVVCLPSRHEGGEVWLSHAGKTEVLDTSATSQFDLTTLAWYSDVTHEVKPLTSGYRLVLTYNLVQDDPLQKQAASLLIKNRQRLAHSLAACRMNMIHQSSFVYLLDHQYTEASLRLEKLKGRDAAVGQYLNHVCTKNGFYFLLADMTGSFRDAYDEGDEDENYISLNHIISPDGRRISDDIEIVKENILDDEAFSGDCDSEDEQEFTGNESMPAAYRYHKTVSSSLCIGNPAAVMAH